MKNEFSGKLNFISFPESMLGYEFLTISCLLFGVSGKFFFSPLIILFLKLKNNANSNI